MSRRAGNVLRLIGPLTVSVADDGTVSIRLRGMRSSFFKPASVEHWIKELCNVRNWMIGSAAGYSEEFVIESSDGSAKEKGFESEAVCERVDLVFVVQMSEANANVSLPEGVSLKRVAEVLLDAWEVGSHQWTGSPLELKEAQAGHPPAPLPSDALDLFRVLHEAGVPYLLVGGVAMLTYVEGRNTKDVDLLMSATAMRQVPELNLLNQEDCFVRGRFRSVQVNLLLTTNPLFKTVEQRFAARHRFAELEVPVATVEGLIVLKLYALPSLCRQLDWDRVYVYESDVKQLLARYHPAVEPLLALLEPHILASDLRELRKFINEEQERRRRAGEARG